MVINTKYVAAIISTHIERTAVVTMARNTRIIFDSSFMIYHIM